MKLNLGCGSNILDGWVNCDLKGPRVVDLCRLPLPFDDASADYILAEHVVEHLTSHEAWRLLEDCHRVLVPGGVIRVCVPSLPDFARNLTLEHRLLFARRGWCVSTPRAVLRMQALGHGHKSLWCGELLLAVLGVVGFHASRSEPLHSVHSALDGIDGHGNEVGVDLYVAETAVVEGIKR